MFCKFCRKRINKNKIFCNIECKSVYISHSMLIPLKEFYSYTEAAKYFNLPDKRYSKRLNNILYVLNKNLPHPNIIYKNANYVLM